MKPYAKAQTIKLVGMQDRRRRLTEEEKDQIRELYAQGQHSQRSLARLYHVSRSLIAILVNPERAKKVRERARAHWKEYHEKHGKARHAALMRSWRSYKYALYKQNNGG